ncbi:MAG: hypothetical protein BAJATHORv1_60114 [Candidatus Thorarchaeota archaeon]|nr:MAG: hypothetical protein BAJATHORv1_60114 [Candidatus Thorarchaeota archaeon]
MKFSSYFLLLVILLLPIPVLHYGNVNIDTYRDIGPLEDSGRESQEQNEGLVTWTSPKVTTPVSLANNSVITGDHIELSINPNLFEYSSYTSKIYVETTGYINHTYTGELVVPDTNYDFTNSPIYGYEDQYTWIEVKGLRQGFPVYLTGNFTNEDTDFFGWQGNIDPEEYTYLYNTLGDRMVSKSKPETATIYWSYPSDTLVIAIFSWSHDSGNFSLHVEQGRHWEETNENLPAEFDSYQMGSNYSINLEAFVSSSRGNISQYYVNVTLQNFFAPQVEDIQLHGNQTHVEVRWSVLDRNINETHICEIHISRTRSTSSSLLGYAFNDDWFFEYNTTDLLLADDYYLIITAIDSGNIQGSETTGEFTAGDVFQTPARIVREIQLIGHSLLSFVNGSEGNLLRWVVSGNFSFQYQIVIDGLVVRHTIWKEGPIEINLDYLEQGEHHVIVQASCAVQSAYGKAETMVIVYDPMLKNKGYLDNEFISASAAILILALSMVIVEVTISRSPIEK